MGMIPHPRTDARMTRTPAHRFLAAFAGSPLDTRPDAELLDRFARYGERPALEAVVRRHAALVRGVCRRHLGPTADADDAFQATFLVLLRHVGRGRPPARVGPWLYSVAVKTAARLRSRRRFQPLTDAVPDRTPAPDPAADWVPLLDQELAGLPAKYRDALVLCELQGRSRREAATTLGLAEGTLSSRLSRGRELLRRRLLKHGTLLPAVGLGLVAEAVSAELVTATVALADGAVPAAVAAAVPAVSFGLWKLLAVGLVAVAGGLVTGDRSGPPATPEKLVPDQPKPVVVKPATLLDGLQGVWRFEDVVAEGAAVEAFYTSAKRESTSEFGSAFREMMTKRRDRDRFVVHGDRWWWQRMGVRGATPFTVTLDPAKTPPWIDLTPVGGPHATAALPHRGVYRLSGDTLEFIVGTAGRAAEFTAAGGETFAVRYRKQPQPPVGADLSKFLGRWRLVRRQSDWPADRDYTKNWQTEGWLEVTPAVWLTREWDAKSHHDLTARDAPQPEGWTVTTDPSRNPAWIDMGPFGADNPDYVRHGVYSLDGDSLRTVVGPSGERLYRPLDFAVSDRSPPRGWRTVTEYRREP